MDHLGLQKYSPASFNKLRCCSSILTGKDTWSKNVRTTLSLQSWAIVSDMLTSVCLCKNWEREKEKTVCERNQNILIRKKNY